MSGNLSPQNAVRLLRAKAGELETQVYADHQAGVGERSRITRLTADIALIAGLLADYIEEVSA